MKVEFVLQRDFVEFLKELGLRPEPVDANHLQMVTPDDEALILPAGSSDIILTIHMIGHRTYLVSRGYTDDAWLAKVRHESTVSA